MNSDYLLLALALIGLWIPAHLLTSAATREKLLAHARRRDEGFGALLASPLNWLDLIRASICTWLIYNSVFHFESGQDELALVFTFVRLAILGIAVLLQTVRIGRQRCVIGPAFFLTGVVVVLAGPAIGLFALSLALTVSLKLRRLSLLFLFAPVCLAAFGVVFGGLGLSTIASAGLFAIPPFFAFALNTRLAFIRRARSAKAAYAIDVSEATPLSAGKLLTGPLTSNPAQQRAA